MRAELNNGPTRTGTATQKTRNLLSRTRGDRNQLPIANSLAEGQVVLGTVELAVMSMPAPASPVDTPFNPGGGRAWTGAAKTVAVVISAVIAVAAVALASFVFVDEPVPVTPTPTTTPAPVGP